MNKLNLLKLKKKLITAGLISTIGFSTFNTNNIIYAKDNMSTATDANKDEKKSISELITYYSNVFDIDESAMYDKLDYLLFECEGNSIENVDEAYIIDIAYNLYRGNEYNCNNAGKGYEPELAPEELIEKYADIMGTNKYLAAAIMYGECTRPVEQDYNYSVNGNPGGLGSEVFPNGEAGIIRYMYVLRDGYGITKDSDDSILAIMAPIYCPPNSDDWLYRDSSIYWELINNGFYTRATKEVQEKHLTLK